MDDNCCITCRQVVRPREEAIQCDDCRNWNHRACNTAAQCITCSYWFKITDEPLENLWGGGVGVVEVQKKYSRKGKLNEKKIRARQLTLKNTHATI